MTENTNKNNQPTGLQEVLENVDKKYSALNPSPAPIFITGNQVDTLCVIEAGGDAISAENGIYPIIDTFREHNIKRPLLIVKGIGETQENESKKYYNQCKKAGLEVYTVDLVPREVQENGKCYEDIAQFYSIDSEGLKEAVKSAERVTIEAFESTLNRSKRIDFDRKRFESVNAPAIPTGFDVLDSESFLDQGLYEGLYILGAISALGKTSIMLQIADQIATSGYDVLYISLEMSAHELMAKSISRYTKRHIKSAYDVDRLPKTVRDITDMKRYNNYSPEEINHIERAVDEYFNDTGDTMRIIEGVGSISADNVRTLVEEHIKHRGRAPVVFLDYLQLLSNSDAKNMTDKQLIDVNVMKLKQISRDFKTPVFTISAFNRANYSNELSMQSFRDSSAIEYTSDCLMALERRHQVRDTQGKGLEAQEGVRARIQAEDELAIKEIRLKILKNRNGQAGGQAIFRFHAKYNYFEELGKEEDVTASEYEYQQQTKRKVLRH